MKNKIHILAFLLIFLSMGLIARDVQAVEMNSLPDPVGAGIQYFTNKVEIKYTPNVPIPISSADGKYHFDETNVVDGDFLAAYIVAIYTYGAGFAGIIAMFMMVIAGWKWLLAGGNAQKITEAKAMINGILIGLALLFGGQLLLRQISEDFSHIQSLTIRLPQDALDAVALSEAQKENCELLKKNNDEDKGECKDYTPTGEPNTGVTSADSCFSDICNFRESDDPDDVCIPGNESIAHDYPRDAIGELTTFIFCADCPDRCTCDSYSDDIYRNQDPCDCDGDGMTFPDPDGCNHVNP